MPDIQSELSKVIQSWETPQVNTETTPNRSRFQTTTNVARATFELIYNNPGIARSDVVDQLTNRGFNRASVQSLLVQMKRQERIKDDNGRLTSLVSQYTPVQSHAAWKNRVAREQALQQKSKPAAKAAPRVTAPAAPQIVTEFDVEVFVNALTLKQAKAVYAELRKVFE